MGSYLAWLTTTKIGDLPSAILGGVIGLILVFLVEWIRNPKVRIEMAEVIYTDPLKYEKDGKTIEIPRRKILKLGVRIKKDWRKYLPIPKNIHAFSKILVSVDWDVKSNYQAKWDNAPEPYDYIDHVVRIEMAPLTMQSENLMYGDYSEVGIAIKHEGDNCFFLFDSDYYIHPTNNNCDKKKLNLKVTFKSSLTERTEEFELKNPNQSLGNFKLLLKESS